MSYTFLHVHVHVPAGGDHFCNAAEKADINSLQLLKHLLTGKKKKSVIQRSYVARRMFGWNFYRRTVCILWFPSLRRAIPRFKVEWTTGQTLPAPKGGGWNSKEGGREKGEYKIGIFENICSPSFAVRTSSTMAGAPLSASCACFTINLAFSSEYSCVGGGTVTWSIWNVTWSTVMYYNISFGGIVFGSHFVVFLVTNYTLETNENVA